MAVISCMVYSNKYRCTYIYAVYRCPASHPNITIMTRANLYCGSGLMISLYAIYTFCE